MKKHYLKYIIRWVLCALLIFVLIFGTIWGFRLYHIYQTYTGKIEADVPDSDEYEVFGVDLCSYQGIVDWAKMEEQDIRFAFLKVSEGIDYKDENFATNWETAQDSGVYVGAYHFYRFEDNGKEQAEFMISLLPELENNLPPVVDVELYESLGETVPDAEETVANLQQMLDTLEAYYGVTPIVYCAPNTYRYYVKKLDGDYPIWISNYYYEPYSHWTFWQYSCQGELEGYDGMQNLIDLNVYRGSLQEFREQFGLE